MSDSMLHSVHHSTVDDLVRLELDRIAIGTRLDAQVDAGRAADAGRFTPASLGRSGAAAMPKAVLASSRVIPHLTTIGGYGSAIEAARVAAARQSHIMGNPKSMPDATPERSDVTVPAHATEIDNLLQSPFRPTASPAKPQVHQAGSAGRGANPIGTMKAETDSGGGSGQAGFCRTEDEKDEPALSRPKSRPLVHVARSICVGLSKENAAVVALLVLEIDRFAERVQELQRHRAVALAGAEAIAWLKQVIYGLEQTRDVFIAARSRPTEVVIAELLRTELVMRVPDISTLLIEIRDGVAEPHAHSDLGVFQLGSVGASLGG